MSADAAARADDADGEAVLRTEGVLKTFGGLTAVDRVDLRVGRGEIVGLIGPNGAGKSTLFDCITGRIEPDAGRVGILGEDVTGWPQHRIAQLGVARLFQQTRVFADMTVRRNLLAAGQRERTLLAQFRRPSEETAARADELLAYVDLGGVAGVRAGRLSFGQQKLLEFAMALMAEPELLLMDEPAGGINPAMIERMLAYIRETNTDEGVTVFLIEHDMEFVMEIADRIYALAHGERIAEGTPAEIREDERVLDAYLGRE